MKTKKLFFGRTAFSPAFTSDENQHSEPERVHKKFRLNTFWMTVVFVSFFNVNGWGQRTASVTGNWSSTATWGGANVPGSGDAVTINSGITVTVDVTAECASITINSATAANGITISGSNSLTVGGAVTINAPSSGVSSTLAVGSGTFTSNSISISGGSGNRIGQLTIGTGIATINGGISFGGTPSQAIVSFTSGQAGILNLRGNFGTGGSLNTNSAGTIIFNGTGAQEINGPYTFNNLTITNTSDAVTALNATTVSGTLIVNTNATFTGNAALTLSTVTIISSGILNVNTASSSLASGNVTVSGTMNINAASTIAGDITVNGSVGGSNTLTLSGTNSIYGSGSLSPNQVTMSGNRIFESTSALSVSSIFINSGTTATNNGNISVTGNINGNHNSSSIWTNASNSVLTISGSLMNTGVLNATGNPNTIDFNGGAQTVKNTTYNNLTLSGSGTKTAAGNLSIAGTLTNSVTLDMATNSISSVATVSNTGIVKTQNTSATPIPTGKTWGGTVEYNSSSAQTIVNGDYAALNASGGIRTLASTGTIGVSGTFTPGGGAYTITGSTVSFNGSSAQTAPSFTFNNMTVGNAAGVVLGGNLTVAGALSLSSGNLTLGSNTLTLNGTVSGGGSGTLTGSATSVLSIGGSGALGTLSMNQASKTTRTIRNLTLNRSGGSATLGNTMEVTGTVTLSGGTLTSTGNLVLVSTASGTARIAAITGGGAVSGNVVAQRNLNGGTLNNRTWRYLSSPVSGVTFDQIEAVIPVTGPGGVANGFTAGAPLNNPSINWYQESNTGDRTNGWIGIGNTTESMVTGAGYSVFHRGTKGLPDVFLSGTVPDNATLAFTGPIHAGNVSLPVTYNASTPTALPDEDGWNLVGNPYPSQIDWLASSGWTKTNLNDAIYEWNPSNRLYGTFINETTTNGATRYIASGQAFFVKANAASPVLSMTETIKVSNNPSDMFKVPALKKVLHIRMANTLGNYDETIIRYHNQATAGFDGAYDAYKLTNSFVNLSSWNTTASIKMAINTMKDFKGQDTIPLRVSESQAGSYSFEMTEPGVFHPKVKIWLHDSYLNNWQEMRSNPTYFFAITSDPATYADSRFRLFFDRKNKVGPAVQAPPRIVHAPAETFGFNAMVYPNPVHNSLTLRFDAEVSGTVDIRVMDITGRILYSGNVNDIWPGTEFSIPVTAYPSGIYFLILTQANNPDYRQQLKFIRH